MDKNCGRDVKESLIPWLKRCCASWNWQIMEHGFLVNARLPQKVKTKHIGRCERCNKGILPEA